MSPSSARTSTEKSEPPHMRVRNWPLMQELVMTGINLSILVVASVAAAYASGQAWVGVVLALLLGVVFWRTWIPVEFEVGPRGITQNVLGRKRRMPWREVAGFTELEHGVQLHQRHVSQPAGNLRELFIRCPQNRPALVKTLTHYLDQGDRSGSTASRSAY